MVGVSLLTISELMGYKTIQMTKRYSHLAPAHIRVAVIGWRNSTRNLVRRVQVTPKLAPRLKAALIRPWRVCSK